MLKYYIIGCILIITSLIVGFVFYTKKVNKIVNNFIKNINDNPKKPTLDSIKRLELTEKFLKFIDDLIDYEIINHNRKSIFLSEQSRSEVNYDDIIKGISNDVFNGISRDYITDPNLILSTKYLTKYIAKRSFIKYMIFLNEYHKNI